MRTWKQHGKRLLVMGIVAGLGLAVSIALMFSAYSIADSLVLVAMLERRPLAQHEPRLVGKRLSGDPLAKLDHAGILPNPPTG